MDREPEEWARRNIAFCNVIHGFVDYIDFVLVFSLVSNASKTRWIATTMRTPVGASRRA
jgi:hypothetical protein